MAATQQVNNAQHVERQQSHEQGETPRRETSRLRSEAQPALMSQRTTPTENANMQNIINTINLYVNAEECEGDTFSIEVSKLPLGRICVTLTSTTSSGCCETVMDYKGVNALVAVERDLETALAALDKLCAKK